MNDASAGKQQRRQAAAPSEDDYRAFCAALSESARGRAFLAEYARRNRHADTEMLLAALDRLEALMRADGTALERLRDELRMLLIAIRLARPDIDAASPATKAAKLACSTCWSAASTPWSERRGCRLRRRREARSCRGAGRSRMPRRPPSAVVPPPDEPELPIPSPAPPAIAPGASPAKHARVVMPVMPAFTPRRAQPRRPNGDAGGDLFEPRAAAAAGRAELRRAGTESRNRALPPARADPLAAIMALSEDERIALFT